MKEGPTVTVERSCHNCRHVSTERYRVQGDSGTDVRCDHPARRAMAKEDRYIGDTRWDTPEWCPVEAAALERAQPEVNLLLEWAVLQWREQVEHRPLNNVRRPTMDRVWRQVIRHAGGDPEVLIGPDHFALTGSHNVPDSDASEAVDIKFRLRIARMLAELHGEEVLSEQQCARYMRIDLVSWRRLERCFAAGTCMVEGEGGEPVEHDSETVLRAALAAQRGRKD